MVLNVPENTRLEFLTGPKRVVRGKVGEQSVSIGDNQKVSKGRSPGNMYDRGKRIL